MQSALLRIFDRMVEVESNTRLMFDKSSQSSARVLFLKSQYGCLVGLGGSIIKEMVNATGARIQILEDTDVPACASNFELVLQASIFCNKSITKIYGLVVFVSLLSHSSLSYGHIAAIVNLLHVNLTYGFSAVLICLFSVT